MTPITDPAMSSHLADDARSDGVHQLVVGAVIANDGHVLLLRRLESDFMGGIYELPSGKVEPGETLDTALRREVQEETGLDVATIDGYLGSFDYTSANGKKSRQFNFTTSVTVIRPVRLQEHDTYLWAPPAAETPVTDAVKNVLANYVQAVAG